MVKKFIAIFCITVLTVFSACSKNKESVKESVEVSDLSLFLQVVQGVEEADSFYTVAEGCTKSVGVKQKISARRYVIGDTLFKESISYSGIVKVANQTYVSSGKYLLRESKKVSSVSDVEWEDTATDLGESEYLSRYGSVILGLNNYILNEQTVTGISLTKGDVYEFVVTADVVESTKHIVKEMRTNANSKEDPIFTSVKMTVKTTKSLEVISVKYECSYKIKIAVLGKVECSEDMTEYFYGFNQTESFGEQSFFNSFL